MKKLIPRQRQEFMSIRSDGRLYIPRRMVPTGVTHATVEYNDAADVEVTFHTTAEPDALVLRQDHSGNMLSLGGIYKDLGMNIRTKRLIYEVTESGFRFNLLK